MKELASKKLNVGCGYDYRKGYVNVDLHERHGPDVVANVLELHTFPTGQYEELVAQDVLEHVTRADVRRALFEWNRVLAVGGRLFVRTTELGGLIRSLEAPENAGLHDQERLIQNVFGTQAYTGDFHLAGFTESIFRFYLWEAGFEVETLGLYVGAFLDCWARKARNLGFERVTETTPDDVWLTSLFNSLMGRPPSAAELDAERATLKLPRGRDAVVEKLLLSEERKNAMMGRAPAFPRTLHQVGLVRRAGRRLKRTVKSLLPL
jgi:predicted SAM-dependent methyltransferase